MEVLGKLGAVEQRLWTEIQGQDGNKRIPVENLCREAQRRLLELDLDDLDDLWELRTAGAERVWTVRHGSVLYLLWWDPDHEVCPSSKR